MWKPIRRSAGKKMETFLRAVIFPEEVGACSRRHHGLQVIGAFRSPNVVPLEQWRQREGLAPVKVS